LRGRVEAGFEQLPCLPCDLARLERAVRQVGARLVIIDPIMAFFDKTVCTGNHHPVRQALPPLAGLAKESRTAAGTAPSSRASAPTTSVWSATAPTSSTSRCSARSHSAARPDGRQGRTASRAVRPLLLT
jgi:hypothetical protein